MGLSRKEVATALQAEISGYTVAQYLEGDQAIDMVSVCSLLTDLPSPSLRP